MKRLNCVVFLLLLLLLVNGLLTDVLAATSIKSQKVKIPVGIDVDQSYSFSPLRYWRGNVIPVGEGEDPLGEKRGVLKYLDRKKILKYLDKKGILKYLNLSHLADWGIRDNKRHFPHVPTLVEYNIEFIEGGQYEWQAKFIVTQPSPARVTIDGQIVTTVFQKPADFSIKWSSLGKFSLRPGFHKLRITSLFVDTPFPKITAMRLVFKGGKVPNMTVIPKVVGSRRLLEKNWYRKISRKIHLDFHSGGFVNGIGKDFNPDEFAETLINSGVNSIVIFAKGHHGYAYYNTKVGTRHPGLDFDLMQAMIEASHKRNITVWVYFSIAVDDLYGTTQHRPGGRDSRRFLDVNANPETYYIKDYMWPMIEETVRNYDIDGIFFDFGGNEEFIKKTVQLIKDIKPGIVVAFNQQWGKSREELERLDVLEIESPDHKGTLYHWQYISRYARGSVPITAMTTRFWMGWGDFGSLADEAMLRYEVATALANGAGITIGDQLHPYGKLNKAAYQLIGRIFKYAQQIEPYVINAVKVPYVALLKQSETASHALIDGSIHFTVIDEKQPLALYTAVIIPDGSKIEAGYLRKLATYVQGGGKLIVTGKPTPPLAEFLGIYVVGNAEPSYIRIDNANFPSLLHTDLFTYLPVTIVNAEEGTKTLAPLIWPLNHGTLHVFSHRQSPPMDEPSGHAVVTWKRIGSGEVVYSAAPLLEVYGTYGFTPMREILIALLYRMIPPAERMAQIESQVPLEISLNRQEKRTIVHLVHSPQSRRVNSTPNRDTYVHSDPIIDGMPTVKKVRLHLSKKLIQGKTVREAITGEVLNLIPQGDERMTIQVPDFQISTVLVIE